MRMGRGGWGLFGVLLAVAFLALLPLRPGTVARAQGRGWTPPVQLSTNTPSSWFADVAVDSRGNVHVVWDSGYPPEGPNDPGTGVTMYAVRRDGEWSEPNDIALHLATALSRPAIVVDGADRLHMIYLGRGGVRYQQAPAADAWSAQAWRVSHFVGGLSIAYLPDLAVDDRGVVHAVWEEWIPVELSPEEIFFQQRSPYLADIFYRRSEDGGWHWGEPVDLSHTPNVGSGRVHIAADRLGGVHVSWDEGWDRIANEGDPQVGAYARSLDGGVTWSEPLVFSDTEDAYAQMTVGTDNGTGVLLVWRTLVSNRILYAWSADRGETWSEPRPIPGIYARGWASPFDAYDMATDGLGNIHLVAVGGPEEPGPHSPVALYHLTWNGERWSAPEVVAWYPGPENPEYPRIAVGGGDRLHVVWFTRPEGVSSAGVQVFYSERALGLAVTPVPTWTPVPTPTSTPTPLPASAFSPTPTPHPDVYTPSPVEDLYTESDDLKILSAALFPVLLMVVGIAVRRLRRRG